MKHANNDGHTAVAPIHENDGWPATVMGYALPPTGMQRRAPDARQKLDALQKQSLSGSVRSAASWGFVARHVANDVLTPPSTAGRPPKRHSLRLRFTSPPPVAAAVRVLVQ